MGLKAYLTVRLPLNGEDDKKIRETVSAWSEVKEVSPFVDGEVIVQAHPEDEGPSAAAKIRGVEHLNPAFL